MKFKFTNRADIACFGFYAYGVLVGLLGMQYGPVMATVASVPAAFVLGRIRGTVLHRE